jgi:hypothetical protein
MSLRKELMQELVKYMKEESNYYTPNIEEFHVGFEYEALHSKDWYLAEAPYGWINKEVNLVNNNLVLFYSAIDKGWIRVKHLDREDIESLEIDDSVHIEFYEFVSENEPNIIIKPKSIYNPFFKGKIKNKSELKKILKMIGV